MPMNFADAANTVVSTIERPPLLPPGTYRFVVEKIPALDSSNKDYDFLDFPLKLIAPLEDVDVDALKEFGNLQNVRMRHRFLFNKSDDDAFKRTLFNVKRFLSDHLKVDGVDDQPLKQALNSSVNHQCLAQIKWNQDKNDNEVFHANIAKTAPVA